MGGNRSGAGLASFLVLAACGSGGNAPGAAAANGFAANQSAGNQAVAALDSHTQAPGLPACPFQATSHWQGAVEGGHLNVTGQVDLQMAGFRPVLTERRSAAADTIGFDLALTPEPQAQVTDIARYQRNGVTLYRHGEVYCGGQRIAAFDMVIVQ